MPQTEHWTPDLLCPRRTLYQLSYGTVAVCPEWVIHIYKAIYIIQRKSRDKGLTTRGFGRLARKEIKYRDEKWKNKKQTLPTEQNTSYIQRRYSWKSPKIAKNGADQSGLSPCYNMRKPPCQVLLTCAIPSFCRGSCLILVKAHSSRSP